MGLSTWKDAPDGKIQRFDVVVAKNYLTKEELSAMARIVNAYLDLAELRAEEEVPMTMEDWAGTYIGMFAENGIARFKNFKINVKDY